MHGNDVAAQHQLGPPDSIRADNWPQIEQKLARGDLPLDHPVERAAVEQFVATLRRHPRRVDMLGRLPALALDGHALRDPVFEIGNGLGADAELEEVEGHGGQCSRMRRLLRKRQISDEQTIRTAPMGGLRKLSGVSARVRRETPMSTKLETTQNRSIVTSSLATLKKSKDPQRASPSAGVGRATYAALAEKAKNHEDGMKGHEYLKYLDFPRGLCRRPTLQRLRAVVPCSLKEASRTNSLLFTISSAACTFLDAARPQSLNTLNSPLLRKSHFQPNFRIDNCDINRTIVILRLWQIRLINAQFVFINEVYFLSYAIVHFYFVYIHIICIILFCS